jgi:hypothetical protein
MRQIRNGVFETNSSSTHSICISKEPVKDENIPTYLNIRTDEEFGWSPDCYNSPEEKAAYLCTVMEWCELDAEKEEFLNTLKNEFHIKISYKSKNGYVDHSGEAVALVHELLSNTDKLKRFLFNPESCIYTGNDNSNEFLDACYVADAAENDGNRYEYDWESGENTPVRHPMYDPEHFEYYFKGN